MGDVLKRRGQGGRYFVVGIQYQTSDERVGGDVYAHAPPAVDFIHISTGLLSDVHGYKEDSMARAACTCNWNFMNF